MGYWKLTLKHMFMVACLLVVGFGVSGSLIPTAEAAAGGCRSDPIVTLSDGTVLDVTADIDTDVANVREIHYIVHGPRGVRLISAVSTPTLGFKGKETFTYYDDATPRQYITETLVRTAYNQVGVTSYTTFVNVSLSSGAQLSLQYRPINGFNNQILRMALTR